MNKIESFKVDHTRLLPGLYVSRVDGDITTYDMRLKRPNTEPLLSNGEMHSFEHMFATLVRNGPLEADIIYFGPMGCQTGFYLLVRNANHEKVVAEVGRVLSEIVAFNGEVFGTGERECGNYRNLELGAAKSVARQALESIKGLSEYPG